MKITSDQIKQLEKNAKSNLLKVVLRRIGSAALDLAYVAAGKLDAFWERGLSLWDMAAGTLLIKEAGGKVTEPSGKPWTIKSKDILASNLIMHEKIQKKYKT